MSREKLESQCQDKTVEGIVTTNNVKTMSMEVKMLVTVPAQDQNPSFCSEFNSLKCLISLVFL